MGVFTGKKAITAAALIAASWVTVQSQQAANAATFTESGDAGQTIPTAQFVGPGVDVIQGIISPTDDADLFSFNWGGGDFSASTIGGAFFDTILSIFDSTGILLTQNDDASGTLQSFISLNGLAQGQYFLGISSFANFATDGPTFGTFPGFSEGSYSISLNQPTAVPTPALLPSLLGMGVVALRKKRKDEVAEQDLEPAEV